MKFHYEPAAQAMVYRPEHRPLPTGTRPLAAPMNTMKKCEVIVTANPWSEIDIDDYEKHMSSVRQLQAMNHMMKEQLYAYPAESVMILGIAGGNGLEHVDSAVFKKVYGVDINKSYLKACSRRYPSLRGVLETLCMDITRDQSRLPHADLLIANLFIEYVGYACFKNAVVKVRPKYVSCAVQVSANEDFVSQSSYTHVFDRLVDVLHPTEENALNSAMHGIGYEKVCRTQAELPDGKKLVRTDYIR